MSLMRLSRARRAEPAKSAASSGDGANQLVFRDFHDLRQEFASYEAVGTEDVTAALLPLMRQVVELHEQGQVAPLDGVEALRAERGRLWFENAKASSPRWNSLAITRLQGMGGALDLNGADGDERAAASMIGSRDSEPTAPCFMPDYRCWEHAVGHHDPLTDIYSLGMLGASLAAGFDFTEEEDLRRFVENRRRLTQFNRRLHPVVADVLASMTEPDRRRRAADLPALIHAMENHRQAQRAEASTPAAEPAGSRAEIILSQLRGRLYDLSRRNKILFHKPSSSELNLTEASTPIVLRVDAIRAEQLFTWNGDLADRIAAQETIPLAEYIRFEEMIYAPSVLDKIRAQARKDRNEFGFSQLRLVLCFLRWRNLKEDPETPISSPLLLLPIELKKRRGLRDSYEMRAAVSEAEVNPTLRRYLKLLYDVDMPASLDLTEPGAIDSLYRSLAEQFAESEPGVSLQKIERPSIARIHQRARQRVDLYRKRQAPSGAGLRKFGEIGYSYQPTNFQPLGMKLYHRFVAPASAPNRGRKSSSQMALPLGGDNPAMESLLLESRAQHMSALEAPMPKPRVAPPPSRAGAADDDEIPAPGAESQFAWAFDLCSVTIANFNYRKMSLVRDFDALLDGALERVRGSFDHVFSDSPKPILPAPDTPPLDQRHGVVASDPTQEMAVWRARGGGSYVIQGPPGAGKSQTIANLVADYLGRGKRVLFVCEKRAALDVVYHRLQALGLHHLCALVHDSQQDKRSFVLDLKNLYEGWSDAEPMPDVETRRTIAIEQIAAGLSEFEAYDREMSEDAEGAPVCELATRSAQAVALSKSEERALSAGEAETLPSLRDWRQGLAAARAMEQALARMGSEPILARHPARFVSAEASADPQLFDRLSAALQIVGPHLEKMRAAAQLAVWPHEGAAPLAALFAQIDYAERLAPVAAARRLDILNPDSHLTELFRNDLRWLDEAREALERAQEKTEIWRDKLSPLETEAALQLARHHERSLFGGLSAPWRQARREIDERAGLNELSIKPRYRDLLEDLDAEHRAANEVERALKQLAANLGVKSGPEAIRINAERDAGAPREGRLAKPLLDLLAREGNDGVQQVQDLAALQPSAEAARRAIADCFEGLETLPVDRAFAALSDLDAHRDALPAFAPALRALAEAPEGVRAALRRIDASIDQLEAAIVDRAVERALAIRPSLREVDGGAQDEAARRVAASLDDLRRVNADALIDNARQRFVEHMTLTTRLDLELDPDTQQLRRVFVAARQDLDRELNKSTRFRSVRELMSGPAGLLIRDLKPIWLMSPLSVADVLPLETDIFDVAIFDEASQVPVEEAAPTVFRAPQVIVVGDEKQLPPTNFFGGGAPIDDDLGEDGDEDWVDLDSDSFLGQAAKTLPSTLLGWHYRSRSEELIAFSNAVFYGGKLISVPSVRRPAELEEIRPTAPEDGAETWRETLGRAVSFHHTPFAAYERQKNRAEAEYVAEMVRGLLMAKSGKSIGVVAFSEAQQSEIERALEHLAREDAKFRAVYETELEREEEGQFAGLFVKNLENVQGDERDVIIVSVCYGPDRTGRMRMNFGPINRIGGERRLNVIFSRAKEHIAIVSTIKSDAITNDYNTGALCLKTYLRYAEAASGGDLPGMRRALSTVAPHAVRDRRSMTSPLAERIAEGLRARGLEAEVGVGESSLVCDVAVRRADSQDYQLALLIDNPDHYSAEAVERYVLKPSALEAFGWRTMRILALDWRRDPRQVLDRIERVLVG